MKTNSLGKVSIKTSERPQSRFDFSHNVNTTFGFGETQPLMCRLLVPGSKSIVSTESLVRLAPMISPTFGLMKMKTWHYFVAMSDLSRNFAAFLGETKVQRGTTAFYPTEVPRLRLDILSSMILHGAHCSIWKNSSSNADSLNTSSFTTYDTHTHSTEYNAVFTALSSYLNLGQSSLFDNYNGYSMNIGLVCPRVNLTQVGVIYLQNNTIESFFQRTNEQDQIVTTDSNGLDDSLVYLDSADYVSVRTIGDATYAFAFRLSSFGKRLRKILLGCGYQINMQDDTEVSLMPLFAYYKAYYDVFGLMLFSNWEGTSCCKLLERFDNNNFYNFDASFALGTNLDDWNAFVRDLGSCWTTNEQDFVSAHTKTIGVARLNAIKNGGFLSSIPSQAGYSVNDDLNVPIGNDETSILSLNQNSFMMSTNHSQVDSEMLKKLYLWTNRNTIAGKRLESLLRAQGLGDFVDNCKPRFIGYTEVDIDISDVVSQSDTYDKTTNEGSQLGQYGGRGIGYSPDASSKVFTFENDEFGYWITISAIVPYAGYTQMLDGNNKCIKKMDFYNPEFDGLGMEATTKDLIVGSQNVVSESDAALTGTFGFIPRYSSLKVAGNVMNGDFNLRSTRSRYMAFTIDKVLDVGERFVKNVSAGGINSCTLRKLFAPSELPLAGPNPWRYDTRYAWLGNYNRIFSYLGDDINNSDASKFGFVEWYGNLPENFMVHNTVRFICNAPMLPIADSFETKNEGNDGKPDADIRKE